MGKHDLSSDTLDQILVRIDSLTPDSERLWGDLSVERTLRHLRHAMEVAVGKVSFESDDKSNIFTRTIMRFVALNLVKRFPKGVRVAEKYHPADIEELENEKKLLKEAVRNYVEYADEHPEFRFRHPFFGILNQRQWRRFHYLHFDHHLRQFSA